MTVSTHGLQGKRANCEPIYHHQTTVNRRRADQGSQETTGGAMYLSSRPLDERREKGDRTKRFLDHRFDLSVRHSIPLDRCRRVLAQRWTTAPGMFVCHRRDFAL